MANRGTIDNYYRLAEEIKRTGKLPPQLSGSLMNISLSDAQRKSLMKLLPTKGGSNKPNQPTGGAFVPGINTPPASGVPGGGAGGPGGGQPGTIYQNMIDSYTSAQNDAKAANENRYQDILSGYMNRYQGNMADLKNVGDQQNLDLERRYRESGANIQQNLVNSGLSGTTIAPTMAMGNQERLSADKQRLQSGLNRERVGYDQALSGDMLQFMERRDDTYPDMGQLAQLSNRLGQSGYGGATYTPASSRPAASIKPSRRPRRPLSKPSTRPSVQKRGSVPAGYPADFMPRPGV